MKARKAKPIICAVTERLNLKWESPGSKYIRIIAVRLLTDQELRHIPGPSAMLPARIGQLGIKANFFECLVTSLLLGSSTLSKGLRQAVLQSRS